MQGRHVSGISRASVGAATLRQNCSQFGQHNLEHATSAQLTNAPSRRPRRANTRSCRKRVCWPRPSSGSSRNVPPPFSGASTLSDRGARREAASPPDSESRRVNPTREGYEMPQKSSRAKSEVTPTNNSLSLFILCEVPELRRLRRHPKSANDIDSGAVRFTLRRYE